MDKEVVVYIYNGILVNCKKTWNLAICDNMDGPRSYYAKWNKLTKKAVTIWSHSCVESKKQSKGAKQNRTEADS